MFICVRLWPSPPHRPATHYRNENFKGKESAALKGEWLELGGILGDPVIPAGVLPKPDKFSINFRGPSRSSALP
jgi:hypothetical protein